MYRKTELFWVITILRQKYSGPEQNWNNRGFFFWGVPVLFRPRINLFTVYEGVAHQPNRRQNGVYIFYVFFFVRFFCVIFPIGGFFYFFSLFLFFFLS